MPLPHGAQLNAVWGDGPDDVWVGGGTRIAQVLAHWDGRAWTNYSQPDDDDIIALWAASADDVWACTSDTLFHGGTAGFIRLPMPAAFTCAQLAGTASDDVWALAYQGNGDLWHYDGKSWRRAYSPPTGHIDSMWLHARNDLWAIGDTMLVRYNGETWSTSSIDDSAQIAIGIDRYVTEREPLHHVWGSSATDVWASGRCGVTVHFDGTAWRLVDGPDGCNWTSNGFDEYGNMFGASGAPVWTLGTHLLHAPNGFDTPTPFLRTFGNSTSIALDRSAWSGYATASDIWLVGSTHTWHVENGAPVEVGPRKNPTVGGSWIEAIWPAATDDVWLFGEEDLGNEFVRGFKLHRDTHGWSIWSREEPHYGRQFRHVHGRAPDDIWTAMFDTLSHFDGTIWKDIRLPDHHFTAIFEAADGVWLAETGIIERFDPATGTITTRNNDPGVQWNTLWADDCGTLFAGGTGATGALFRRIDASGARDLALPAWSAGIWEIAATTADDVWLISNPSFVRQLLHYDGVTVKVAATPAPPAPVVLGREIAVLGRKDVWLSGGIGIMHFDGSAWTTTAAPLQFPTIVAAGDAIWIAADGPRVLRLK